MRLKLPKDELIRNISVVFLAMSLANVFNLLYQLYMVRNLSAIDYGHLNKLFTMLMIIAIPSGAIQTVVAKFVSAYQATDKPGRTNFLLSSSYRKVFIFGLCLFLIVLFGSRHISLFLQIPSRTPVIIVGATMLLSIVWPVTLGGLQGLEKFKHLGLSMVAGGGLKLLLGIILVSLGFKVMGAISALAIAALFALAVSFLFLSRSFTYSKKEKIDFFEVYKYSYPAVFAILCFMVVSTSDVLLVARFFKPLEAGYYSIAQMVGKIVLFLPLAVATVIFPKASGLHAQNKDTLHLIKKSLIFTGLVCGGTALICILFPSLIIKLLTGKVYLECVQPARLFAVSMTFFALLYALISYHLSTNNLKFIRSLAICTILQVVLISLFHNSLTQVLWIMCANAIFLFLINIYFAFKL